MGDNAAEYGQKLKQFYNYRISDLESAQRLVGSFDEGAQTGAALMRFIMNQYRARHPHANIGALRMLDVGCGVGRYMRAAKSLGAAVDGCDVSDKMIELARADDALADCDLWVTQGYDCGEAPKEAYDIIFSVFCMQHLSHRGLRMKLWSAMAEHLKLDGMAIIEFQNYPDISATDIPSAHANWMESRVSDVSNSEADVWITPDMISYAWADWRANYSDPAMQAVELWPDAASYARERGNHEATTRQPRGNATISTPLRALLLHWLAAGGSSSDGV